MRPTVAFLALALGCGAAARPDPSPAPATAPAEPPEQGSGAAVLDPAPEQPPDPLGSEAAAVVDRQIEAYNRGDTTGFLATYADSVAVQTLGDSVVVRGKRELRQSVREWFARAPGARTEVLERTVLGPFVIDRQRVTGTPNGTPLEAVGIYEVREGLIRRVWTIPPAPTPH